MEQLITKEEKAFLVIMQDYKEQLRYLGIPLSKFEDKDISSWLNIHLNNIAEDNSNVQLLFAKKSPNPKKVRKDGR
jgi:hypothetical protein|tara:strand:+ start:243 stop:470 length:228 start_codon:yes stop_codon:yes gene_type:complete